MMEGSSIPSRSTSTSTSRRACTRVKSTIRSRGPFSPIHQRRREPRSMVALAARARTEIPAPSCDRKDRSILLICGERRDDLRPRVVGKTDSETEGTKKLVPEQIENAPGAGCRPQTSKAIAHQSAEMGCAQLLAGPTRESTSSDTSVPEKAFMGCRGASLEWCHYADATTSTVVRRDHSAR